VRQILKRAPAPDYVFAQLANSLAVASIAGEQDGDVLGGNPHASAWFVSVRILGSAAGAGVAGAHEIPRLRAWTEQHAGVIAFSHDG
jgi:hypothetical protein